jgi:hypothetical protein
MTSNNRNDFLKWYEMNKNKIFDLNQ